MRCRVVTWNVHSCVGTDRRHDPVRVAEVLASLDADVVGLQEVDWRRPRVEGRHQLELLAARLGMKAIAGPNLRDHRGEYGNGLLTRFETGEVRRLRLPDGRGGEGGRRSEPRGAIEALLRGPGGWPLRVLVTHLGLRGRERRAQVAALLAALGNGGDPPEPVDDPPTVLLGDLNEWRPSGGAGPLAPDPFPAVATGRTFPSRFPVFALDRVLLRPVPSALSFEVVRTAEARLASDHLPVVAEVEWA